MNTFPKLDGVSGDKVIFVTAHQSMDPRLKSKVGSCGIICGTSTGKYLVKFKNSTMYWIEPEYLQKVVDNPI